MSTLKVTKIGNGLLDVRMTITEDQFALLQHLATDLYLPAEEPESEHDCEIMEAIDEPGPPPSAVRPLLHGICDDCGEGMMIERTNSTTGNTFLGCSEFPDCKFTKSGGKNPAPPRYISSYGDYDDYGEDDYDPYGWEGDF